MLSDKAVCVSEQGIMPDLHRGREVRFMSKERTVVSHTVQT